MIKNYIIGIAAVLALAANSVGLADSIHSGSPTGAYFNDICPQIQDKLSPQLFKHQCVNSAGTGENILSVQEILTNVGIAQKDVFLDANPENLVGINSEIFECNYAITANPDLVDMSLVPSRAAVGLPGQGSGTAQTFKIMQRMDPHFAEMNNIKNFDNRDEALAAVKSGEVDVYMFTQIPDPNQEFFKQIHEAGLSFMPVASRSILGAESESGEAFYQVGNVQVVPQGLFDKITAKPAPVLDTSCTEIMYITGSPEAAPSSKDQTDMIGLLETVEAPTKGHWKDTLASFNIKDTGDFLKGFKF